MEGKRITYPKIQSIYKRDEKTHKFIEDEFSLEEFEYLRNNVWEWTEKIDGTNIRVMWNGSTITFAGKTDKAQMPEFLYVKLMNKFSNKEMVLKFREIFGEEGNVCLFGEGYGAKIQKSGGNYIPDGVDFILFDILIGNWWIRRQNIIDIAMKIKLDVVPIVEEGTIDEAVKFVKEKHCSSFGDFFMEGLVLKTEVGLKARNGKRIITKMKFKDFSQFTYKEE